MATTDHYVGEIVQFVPRVTGGYVVATVTAVHDVPHFGTSLEIYVTDGTAYWPTGTVETISAEVLL